MAWYKVSVCFPMHQTFFCKLVLWSWSLNLFQSSLLLDSNFHQVSLKLYSTCVQRAVYMVTMKFDDTSEDPFGPLNPQDLPLLFQSLRLREAILVLGCPTTYFLRLYILSRRDAGKTMCIIYKTALSGLLINLRLEGTVIKLGFMDFLGLF